ncbi:MAG: hypothetical protein HYS17_10630 [Micavibrio aeruginosavorus]|uniref:Uncharacterized protein n=1 Tax=Micavibrio aeruginosavorus TaxID=349221 RepID=A0A7T5R1U4_9BACT|nr:MAG: hypothetical protein HYS17_10630 [Micavibrio aeruginosavorus]
MSLLDRLIKSFGGASAPAAPAEPERDTALSIYTRHRLKNFLSFKGEEDEPFVPVLRILERIEEAAEDSVLSRLLADASGCRAAARLSLLNNLVDQKIPVFHNAAIGGPIYAEEMFVPVSYFATHGLWLLNQIGTETVASLYAEALEMARHDFIARKRLFNQGYAYIDEDSMGKNYQIDTAVGFILRGQRLSPVQSVLRLRSKKDDPQP